MNPKPTVKYTDYALIISIPTKTPAVTHEGLMLGISAALKCFMANPDMEPQDAQKMIYLIRLLDAVIPDERQLELANAS